MKSNVRLLDKVKASYGPNYLTLMSITQAVVFSFLVSAAQANYSKYGATEWILAITTLLIIIAVWYEYSVSILVLVWVPNIIDSIIPFALSVCQLLMVSTIDNPQLWFAYSALFCVVGSLAFFNMYYKSKHYEENHQILHVIGKRIGFNKWYPVWAALGFTMLWYLTAYITEYLLSILAVVLYAIYFVASWKNWEDISMHVHRNYSQE